MFSRRDSAEISATYLHFFCCSIEADCPLRVVLLVEGFVCCAREADCSLRVVLLVQGFGLFS